MEECTLEQKAARLAEWAQKGAKLGDYGKMCNECAFKTGSIAQTEEHNVEAAIMCLVGTGTFHCHDKDESGKLIDAGKQCAGYKYAMQYWADREKEK